MNTHRSTVFGIGDGMDFDRPNSLIRLRSARHKDPFSRHGITCSRADEPVTYIKKKKKKGVGGGTEESEADDQTTNRATKVKRQTVECTKI